MQVQAKPQLPKFQDNLKLDYFRIKIDLKTEETRTNLLNLVKDLNYYSFSLSRTSYIKRYETKWRKLKINQSNNNTTLPANLTYCHTATQHWIAVSAWNIGATYLYWLLKNNKLIFSFQNIKLTRLDIAYDRPYRDEESKFLLNYFQECQKNIVKQVPNCYYKIGSLKKPVGYGYDECKTDKTNYFPNNHWLSIGSRRSQKCSRIYTKKLENTKVVRFELELKHNSLNKINNLLEQKNFGLIEKELSLNYIIYWQAKLPKFELLSDWFIDGVRKHFVNLSITNQNSDLTVSYNINHSILDTEYEQDSYLRLISLLAFCKKQTPKKIEKLGQASFALIEFKLTDWITDYFDGGKFDYQHSKCKQFLYQLKTGKIHNLSMFQTFADETFRSCVIIPYVETLKRNGTVFCELSIYNDFFNYEFPYNLPTSFINLRTKNHRLISWAMCECFRTDTTVKILNLNFLLHNSKISSSTSKIRADLIINFLEILIKREIIEKAFLIELKQRGGELKTLSLLSSLSELKKVLRKSTTLRFYEKINKVKWPNSKD